MPTGVTLRKLARGCLVAANRVGAPLDRLFGKDGAPATGPLIIVGLPRSGTTLAYELIVQAFDVAYFSKIYNYTFGLPNLTTRLTTRFGRRPAAKYESEYGNIPGLFTPAENHHFWRRWFVEDDQLGHHVPAAAISGNQARTMNRVLASISTIAGSPLVFKDVYLTLSLDAVLQKVDGCRVLVITRDPDAVAASLYRKRAQMQDAGDWWSIRPPFTETVSRASLVEQVAFQCTRSRQLLEEQLSHAAPERCRVVDYADICNAPGSFIDNMREWLGSEFAPRDVHGIPERFENRPSVGFPGSLGETCAAHADRFETDRDAYLAKVRSCSPAPDAAATAGSASGHPQ